MSSFVAKTVPNKVKGLICHRDFNSTTYQVTRHTANIVNYMSQYLSKYIYIMYISLCLWHLVQFLTQPQNSFDIKI